MRLRFLHIDKLYSAYTYDFDFRSMGDIILLTGPNGYGKTTILNMIDSLRKRNLIFFQMLEFESIKFTFENGRSLLISKQHIEDEEEFGDINMEDAGQTSFEFYNKSGGLISFFYLSEELLMRFGARYARRYRDGYGQKSRITVSTKSMPKIYEEHIELYEEIAADIKQEQFLMLLDQIECTMIPAERVVEKTKDDQYEPSINRIVRDIQGLLRESYFEFLQKAQELDNQWIERLLDDREKALTEEEYNEKEKEISQRILELKKYGLVDDLKVRKYIPKKAEILSVHLNTVQEKIDYYSPLLEKLQLFSGQLEKKAFAHKKVRFSKARGMEFISLESGAHIEPEKLSSGEQNEIYLLYRLIFEVKDGTMLLIDEPENSLHVGWMKCFVEDVESIAETKGLQVFIATHSPDIIGSRWRETYDLYERNV